MQRCVPARELRGLPARELSARLAEWVDKTVRNEFDQLVARFGAVIATVLTELERRYVQRVQRILEHVQVIAEDVFGLRAGDLLPDTGLQTPSRFSFKLQDVETTLDSAEDGSTLTAEGSVGAVGHRSRVRWAE